MSLASSTFPWWVSGFLSSFGVAGFVLFNQQAKINPLHLMVWRGLGIAALYLPVLLFIPLPTNLNFYLAMLVSGLCISYYDYKMFAGVRLYGAGSLSRLQPLGIMVMFVSWFLFSADYRQHFLGLGPEKTIGIVLCLVIAMLALIFARRNPISRDALTFMIPMFIVLAGIDISLKVAITIVPPPEGVFLVPIFNSFVAGLISLFRCYRAEPGFQIRALFDRRIIGMIWLFFAFFVFMSIGKQYSVAAAPSPAYVMAIASMNTLWIFLFNHSRGIRDDSNLRAEFVFVLAVIGLILLSA